MKIICTKKKFLEALEKKVNGHISLQIQFNFESIKEYCEKKTDFILPKYSGKIYKPQWQDFIRNKLLNKIPDDRTVDWIIDPVGNTGKSSFARASDPSKIILATALMEDAKSGHLETTFGGKHKEIENI